MLILLSQILRAWAFSPNIEDVRPAARLFCVPMLALLLGCSQRTWNDQLEAVALHPEFWQVVPDSARLEKIATGFDFLEGPVWHPSGYLLFTDMARHVIYRWRPQGQEVDVYFQDHLWTGAQPRGPNGLAIDPQNRVIVCQHGRRSLARLNADKQLEMLAQSYLGSRFNSPNDIVVNSEGRMFFTDPPFGLNGGAADPNREIEYSGIYSWQNGSVTLLSRSLTAPNGIALAPDESKLYVSNSNQKHPVIMQYSLTPTGEVESSKVWADLSPFGIGESLDGIEVDIAGNLYLASAPGIVVFSASGRLLGYIKLPEVAHNLTWGGRNNSALFIVTRESVFRLVI